MFNISQEILLYILLGITAIVVALLIWNIKIHSRLKKLTRSNKNFSIEDAIGDIDKELKSLGVFRKDIEKYLSVVEKRLSRSIQGVSNVNFQAFKGLDSGGTQSFATALIDEKGNGLIISTLHARDRVNVFTKEIINFKPKLNLSDEEKQALTNAIESCKL